MSLLFTFHSRYSIRYRTWTCILPWMRNTTHIHTTLSSSATTPARVWGPPEYHRVARAVQDHFAPVDSAHPQLEFRPGSSLFARRYWRNLVLISFPGLTDMLKFGPWSRAAQVTPPIQLSCGVLPASGAHSVPRAASPPEVFEN